MFASEEIRRQIESMIRRMQLDPSSNAVLIQDPYTGQFEYSVPTIPTTPESITKIITETVPGMKQFTYEEQAVWVVEHGFEDLPVVGIWKTDAVQHYGFGTQPFGTSLWGGGDIISDGTYAVHEPAIQQTGVGSFTVTWATPTSGTVLVSASGAVAISSGAGGSVNWSEITGKPLTFTPSVHDNTSHSTNYEPEFTKNTGFNKNFGTEAGTVVEGNDSRLSDARKPTSHNHNDLYLSKDNTDAYSPTLAYHPATKQYVDENAGSAGVSSIAANTETPMTGDIILEEGSNVTLSQDPVTKKITIAATGGAIGGVTSLRADAGDPIDGAVALLSGDNITLSQNAVTKEITINAAGGGTTKLIELDDTPASYTGQAGKILVVNETEDGLVFTDPPTGGGSWGLQFSEVTWIVTNIPDIAPEV